MVDATNLAPAERARLLGKPEGELGIAIADSMNDTNAAVIAAAWRRLHLEPGLRVLEVGFGNGKPVAGLIGETAGLVYVGVDFSATMVAEATAYNRALVDAGRASFHLASVEAMPCPDASIDRAVAINAIYFWPDPLRALREIRRVLRPGGLSLIAAIDSATAAAVPFTRAEFGFRIRDAEALIGLHREAGFASVVVEPYDEVAKRPDGSTWPRHYHFVVAEP